ncbi:hypothetical protein [uncultured Oscillibacter sp.]|uniref:hypothetical protein n=1 Tax=uncultured Oscillibacter sp. TaxID=876091 RepID=UPI0025F8F42A|nr:hypothetical protein [uncultured Oscillibacter sp.]
MNNQKKMQTYLKRVFFSLVIPVLFIVPASAGGLAGSTLGVGLKELISDVSALLIVLCPLTAAAAAGFFAIRRSMSDEQDGKLWEKRIKTAIFCGVGGCLVSSVITLLASYF